MLDQKLIFKSRASPDTPAPGLSGVLSLAAAVALAAFPPDSSSPATGTTELTKNSQYCVVKLPASPSILSHASSSTLNGYADHFSKYSVVINEKYINVWSYKSIDSTPLSIEFPLNASSLPPLAILTKPANANIVSGDPGLVIIDSVTGHVKFYESVQHAPALGLINNKQLELTIPLSEGEYITLAENVEPAGIVVATSLKRCVLVGLRDFISKPRLTLTQLTSPVGSVIGGIFSKFFRPQAGSADSFASAKEEIVSIRTSKVIDQGMAQEIVICDSKGSLQSFHIQLVTPNIESGPIVSKSQSFSQYVLGSIENNIDGYLPGSSLNVKVLDLWPQKDDEHYLFLCETEPISDSPSAYYLVLLKINKTGVLYYKTHMLRTPPAPNTNRPKLFLPKPYNTAFVIIGNSVTLTDVGPSSSGATWEDSVRLKASVQIIGQGYEDESPNEGTNPAVVLLTTDNGVLRVEKFPFSSETDADVSMDIDETESSPISIIKSHIEQAIFFAKSREIEFDLFNNGDRSYTERAIKISCLQIIDEILTSSSRYLPEFLPSVKDFINLKISLYRELIAYTKRNFPTFCHNIIPNIVERLEKASVGLELWKTIEVVDSLQQLEILKTCIAKYVPSSVEEDSIRYFLNHKLQHINPVLTEYIESLVVGGESLSFVKRLLVNTLYHGVFKYEEEYILQDSSIELRKIWIFETDLVMKFEEIFRKLDQSTRGDFLADSDSKRDFVFLCEVLYYFVTSAVQYMQHFETSSKQLRDYVKWYRSSKVQWIEALTSRGLEREAIGICETYRDLYSLVEILEKENARNGVISNSSYYSDYFELFGYEFASALFDYYLANDLISQLILGFVEYKPLLARYFVDNPEKSNGVAWIRDFLDEDFAQGSQRLVESTTRDERVETKELKLSLAKLAALAQVDDDVNDGETEILHDINSNLVVLRIQEKLFKELSKSTSGEGELLTLEYVSKNFKNASVDADVFQSLAGSALKLLAAKKAVGPTELILLLTLLKPTLNSGKNFAYALRISSLITNEAIYRDQSQLVWLRLLTIADDWKVLSHTENQTDELVKQRVSNSILYKTLRAIGIDNDLVEQLKKVISHPFTLESSDSFTNELAAKLTENIEKHDLPAWVNSIKLQVSTTE